MSGWMSSRRGRTRVGLDHQVASLPSAACARDSRIGGTRVDHDEIDAQMLRQAPTGQRGTPSSQAKLTKEECAHSDLANILRLTGESTHAQSSATSESSSGNSALSSLALAASHASRSRHSLDSDDNRLSELLYLLARQVMRAHHKRGRSEASQATEESEKKRRRRALLRRVDDARHVSPQMLHEARQLYTVPELDALVRHSDRHDDVDEYRD